VASVKLELSRREKLMRPHNPLQLALTGSAVQNQAVSVTVVIAVAVAALATLEVGGDAQAAGQAPQAHCRQLMPLPWQLRRKLEALRSLAARTQRMAARWAAVPVAVASRARRRVLAAPQRETLPLSCGAVSHVWRLLLLLLLLPLLLDRTMLLCVGLPSTL